MADLNLFWGDIHNHCGISYGYGSLEKALEIAKDNLDFCAITGHAMWPDMAYEGKEWAYLENYHKKGFEKLAVNWEQTQNTINRANQDGLFTTFQSYEMHSRKYGDYHVVSKNNLLPILNRVSPEAIISELPVDTAIAIAHHPGYTTGSRGIAWDLFNERITPVVEVFSKHGCAMYDNAPYPYYHSMGPRDGRSTIHAGLEKGYQFGFVGSTDHHAGYPGSYGSGMMAVMAQRKTRQDIWEGIVNRHTYAVTGDRILCNFRLNGKIFGSKVQAEARRDIQLDITACGFIDRVTIYKNCKILWVLHGESIPLEPATKDRRFKVRIEMGWGFLNRPFLWDGNIVIRDGVLEGCEKCYRGRNILAPSSENDTMEEANLLEHVMQSTVNNVQFRCTTFCNPTPIHAQTSSIILEISGDSHTSIGLNVNQSQHWFSIGELLHGSRSFHMDNRIPESEAVMVHQAVPESCYNIHYSLTDKEKTCDCDVYHVEVRQLNNQCAWISPIYVYS